MKEIAGNNPYWEKFSRFVHAKTLRERVVILMVIVVFIYGVIDLLFLGAILDKRERQANQLNGLLESNKAAQQEVQDLINQISEGQLAMQRQQQMLNDKLDKVDQQLSSAATGFIPATLMPKVLEQLLDIDKNGSEPLALIKLENKPVERVTGLDESAEAHTEENDAASLYRHGVELRLQGSYLATLAYLKRLEELQWRLEWETLVFEIQEYPVGTVTLEVYTYSTERDWIGV